VDTFKQLLINNFGSVFAGWRQRLDVGQKGCVTKEELAAVCRELGAQAVNSLWKELDHDGHGRIYLSDLAPEVAGAFQQFEILLLERYGSAWEGWQRCFQKAAPPGMHIGENKFVRQCEELGFRGDAAELFRLLQASPSRKYLIYEDLWSELNPCSPELHSNSTPPM